MNEDIVRLLHEGGHSLVISNGNMVRTFDGRGISDLRRLLEEEPDVLKGASLADKVVGKAAAALMILGGVGELHADVISSQALALLAQTAIKIGFDKDVPHIVNRANTGWCPMETCCKDCQTAKDCLVAMDGFIASMRQQKA